jgi:hypothetical protein
MTARDRAIVARWRARLAARRRLLAAARRRHEWRPTAQSLALIERRKAQVAEAERVIARRRAGTPRILDLGVTVEDRFGRLGEIERTIGHCTAGPRDRSDADALRMWRQYHTDHASRGWGGIGYHYGIASSGSIVLLRPIAMKGAHTAGRNTGSVGVVVHGSIGERMTPAQRAALTWLYDHAHTAAMPQQHRAPRSLRGVTHGVHRDYTATACPDAYAHDYKAA